MRMYICTSFKPLSFGGGSWDVNFYPHSCYQSFLPVANTWYHLVLTRDNTTLTLYIDGNLICSQATGNSIAAGSTLMDGTIGSRGNISSQNFVGDIDELKIFNRVLSVAEIINLTSSCTVTGIEDQQLNNNTLIIFPNPVADQLSINGIEPNGLLSVFNSYGEKVSEIKTADKSFNLNTEHFAAGVYLISYRNEMNIYFKKFVKE